MNPPGEHHPDGAFDDPLHDWWQKNGKSLIAGAVIVIVGTAAVFGFRIYRQSQEQSIQIAFNEAVSSESLESFAQENAGYPLGGVAALQTANTAFENQEWDQALANYKIAAESLKGNPLSGKARLGIAVTQSEMGNNEEAQKILSALANDEKSFPASRAEAMYFLSLLSLESGDYDSFSQWSSKLAEIDQIGQWTAKLGYYEDRTPLPVIEVTSEERAETASTPEATAETEAAVEVVESTTDSDTASTPEPESAEPTSPAE